MSAKTNGLAQGTVLKVAYSMLGLTSSVVLTRIVLNILKPRRLTASDWGMVECSIGMANFYPAIHVNAHFYQPLSLAAALRSPFSSKLCDRRTHTIHVATGGRPIATRIRKEGADWSSIQLGVNET